MGYWMDEEQRHDQKVFPLFATADPERPRKGDILTDTYGSYKWDGYRWVRLGYQVPLQ